MPESAQWVDNVLVAADGSMFTVFPSGRLEIRGPGWERRKPGDSPLADRPRVCNLDNEEQARRVAELITQI